MDIVKKKRIREWTLLALVGAMALVANLPADLMDSIGIPPAVAMAVLGLVVVLALFLYVRFFFFLLYTLLAVGANLPEQWAEALGISQGPLLATLIAMVTLSLLNYGVKLLPSGLEPRKPKANPEATQVLIMAIERGNQAYIKAVLGMEFDLNLANEQGITPLMKAAERGDMATVEILLDKGAQASITGPQGKAADMALRASHPAVAERIKSAEEAEAAAAARQAAAAPPDADSVLGD